MHSRPWLHGVLLEHSATSFAFGDPTSSARIPFRGDIWEEERSHDHWMWSPGSALSPAAHVGLPLVLLSLGLLGLLSPHGAPVRALERVLCNPMVVKGEVFLGHPCQAQVNGIAETSLFLCVVNLSYC